MEHLSADALADIAGYFQALSEPSRLQLLNLLRHGARNVTELAALTHQSSANVSRHLALLTAKGIVSRESRGVSVYFRVADPAIFQMCDLVCGQIERQFEAAARKRAAFARGPATRVGEGGAPAD
jgi:DNA-binding transcriptional ArsR family regulator